MFQKMFLEDTDFADALLIIYLEMVKNKMYGLRDGLILIRMMKFKKELSPVKI